MQHSDSLRLFRPLTCCNKALLKVRFVKTVCTQANRNLTFPPPTASSLFHSRTSPEQTATPGTAQHGSSLPLTSATSDPAWHRAEQPYLPASGGSPLLPSPQPAPAKRRTLTDPPEAVQAAAVHPELLPADRQGTPSERRRALPPSALMQSTAKGRERCSELLFTNRTSSKGWPIIQPTQYLRSFCFTDPIATG